MGSDPEIQVATVVSNHLTAGVIKYFGASGRYQQAANLFEKLAVKEPEVASLLAKSYIGMSAYTCVSQDVVLTCQQTRRSRRFKSCQRRCNTRHIRIRSCTSRAISCVPKVNQPGLSNWPGKLSIVHRANL